MREAERSQLGLLVLRQERELLCERHLALDLELTWSTIGK